MKNRICLFLLLALFGLFPAALAGADFTLVVATDPHYIAPSLTDGGAYYQAVLRQGDSKFMPCIEPLTEEFFTEVLELHPDALLLTGDLTFNGAIESHEALIEKLRAVEDTGIPVLVTTGNHDVYNFFAARYEGDSFFNVPSATTQDFGVLYADFGLNEATAVDGDSLSYVYPLPDGTRLLVLDLNTLHDFCGISGTTLDWVEQQLQQAQADGAAVIAAGHQNLFQHTVFRDGYVIGNAEKLASLLRQYGVSLYLSGHLHIQHIQTEDGLTEIAGSALCSYPCQYGVLTAGEAGLSYETRRLDLAAWAERTGDTDPIYQRFSDAAGDYMDAHFSVDTRPDGVSPADWPAMLNYLRSINRAYFAGDLTELSALDPDGQLAAKWLAPGDRVSYYVNSVMSDSGKNFCHWSSP